MGKILDAEKRIEQIKKYIKSNCGDNFLTMESIALHVGLNPRYMLRLFKEHTGMLLKDYVLEARIDKATALLKTKMTIETVAKKCGYTSSHSFIRAFKRVHGITPGEFKRANKNDLK